MNATFSISGCSLMACPTVSPLRKEKRSSSAKTDQHENESNGYTITSYDVNDTRRETGFVNKACKFERSKWCYL